MAAIEQLITDNIDVWLSAVKTRSAAGRGSSKKLDLYGIKKLRELILELAVRGLLVRQDPDDEPASVLLDKIAVEKKQLIIDKKIKKPKVLPDIEKEVLTFDIPDSWSYVRLGEIGNIFNGNSVNARIKEEKYSRTEGLPYIATKDVSYGFEPLNYENGIAIPIGEPKFKVAKKGSVLICSEGGSAGKKCGIAEQDICFGNKLYANELYGNIEPKFILSLYLSPSFYSCFSESMTGIIGGISTAKFLELPATLPPLKEQKRIVDKVDKLMILCDQFEQQQENSISAHKLLVETLLSALTNAAKKGEFDNAWTRIAERFDTLFTTEHSVDQLKQTVLQLAVMGKLVPQDPNDEPASVLLGKIAVKKERLVKDGKIRKQKQLSEISGDELGFKIPIGWAMSRLGTFTNVGTGATPSRVNTAYWSPQEINWVASGETSNDFITETSEKISFLAVKETNVSVYPVGTLIVAMYGQGKTRGQVTELMIEAGTNQACAAVALINKDDAHRKYLKIFFKKAYEEMRSNAAGGAQPNLNVGKISNTVIPLPPLGEQHRIVIKTDELMALCDTLKSNINTAQITQLHLADAIAEQALN